MARLLPWLAFACVFPALVFLMVNVVEWLAGNDGGPGVFGSSLEPWSGALNAVVGAGPFLAVALLLASAGRVRAVPAEDGAGVRSSWRVKVLGVVAGLLAMGVVVHLLSRNGVVVLPDSWDIW